MDALDDVSVSRVEFYVNDRLVGSDQTSLFSYLYDTVEGETVLQTYTAYAIAYDSSGNSSRSQVVNFTLGQDEEPPVVNIASPQLTGTDGGVEIAEVIENSTAVVKVAGYDNVGVKTLVLRGLRQVGSDYVLTGSVDDVLTGGDFAPQQIPGTLKAFSALKLVNMPAYSGASASGYDAYPLEVTAIDDTGNESTAQITIAVVSDAPPTIVETRLKKDSYLPRDILEIDVQARDDLGVTAIDVEYFLDGAPTSFASGHVDTTSGLVPGENVQSRFVLNLADHGISNAAHQLRIRVTATDSRGANSATDGGQNYELLVDIIPDNEAPLAAIHSPVENASLYHGDTVIFEWKSLDASQQASINIIANGQPAHSSGLSASIEEGEFSYTVPPSGDSLVLSVTATDVFGNSGTSTWNYRLVSDEPPSVSIRQPAAGTRFVEGEPFTMSAQVSDNRSLALVEFFVELDGVTLESQAFTADEANTAQADAAFLVASMRTPHRTEGGTQARVGVRAVDDNGLVTIEYLDVVIHEDIEPPVLSMTRPESAISVLPGKAIDVAGVGEDNFYVTDVRLIIRDDQDNETELPWEVFTKKDRVEQQTAPNPLSFGELIVGERFFTEFSGQATLPATYFDHVGEVYELFLRASDHGVNSVDTPAVKLTVLGDTTAPTINIESPPTTVYDRQPLEARVRVSDDVSLQDYRVTLVDEVETVVVDKLGLDVTSDNSVFEIDLSTYVPIPQQGKTFSLNVVAHDAAGNETSASKQVLIEPDQAPVVTVTDVDDDTGLVKGGLIKFSLDVVDDYVSGNDPVVYFPFYTSLRGLEAGAGRDPVGIVTGSDLSATGRMVGSDYRPAIDIGYPEAGTLETLLQVGSATVLSTAEGRMTVNPQSFSGGILKLTLTGDYSVSYEVRRYTDTACSAMVSDEVVAGDIGVDLNALQQADVVTAIIRPIVVDNTTSAPVDLFLQSIRVDLETMDQVHEYEISEGRNRWITPQLMLSYQVRETLSDGSESMAFISSRNVQRYTSSATSSSGHAMPTPVRNDFERVVLLAHAVDSLSHQRGDQGIEPLYIQNLSNDDFLPELDVVSPAHGITVKPLTQLKLKLDADDNSELVETVKLFENGTLVRETAGRYQKRGMEIIYEVPRDYLGGDLDLQLVATDPSGYTATKTLSFPVEPNVEPQLSLTKFSSYLVDGEYRRVIDSADRLNFGEFFVRTGENFKLETTIDDDVGLERYTLYRIQQDGQRVVEYQREMGNSCPAQPIRHDAVSTVVQFNELSSTRYDVELEDTYGNLTTRSFLVHPLANMVPGIRIVSPADNQFIAAGTFRIAVGVVAADDRKLSLSKLEFFVNGTPLTTLDSESMSTLMSTGGDGRIDQAFASIYDDIEQNYTIELANEYGNRNSPNSIQAGTYVAVPQGLITTSEPVTITALITDSDGAVGRHSITIQAAPDDINPEVIISKPEPGFAVHELGDMTLGFSAFDNVKVGRMELYTAYGVRTASNEYLRSDYGLPVRTIDDIEPRDFEPVTTVNIDTPEYLQLLHVDRIADLYGHFSGLVPSSSGDDLFDVWVKVVAVDASGNSRVREVSYPILVDERPVLDIVTPEDGQKVVESAPVVVNVKAFDDVGLSSVRLIANRNGTEFFNLALQAPPYSFQLDMPAFDSAVPANNIIQLSIEAIDTYGAAFGDLDEHRAIETVNLEVVTDEAPVVSIGAPLDGSRVIEGDHVLVQVNAVDDVGIDKVILTASNLIDGERILADTSYPYEFLIQVPYGQAGQDVVLTATTTEVRYTGNARSVVTAKPTRVQVDSDVDAPTITIVQPDAGGVTVVENRGLAYEAEIEDNVKVNFAQIKLFAGTEIVYQRDVIRPPYAGTIPLGSIEDYMGDAYTDAVTQLPLKLEISANDGAGNPSVATHNDIVMLRNAIPTVTGINILDKEGYSLGNITEVTEGRDIVVNVLAEDPEVGVDSAVLYQAVNAVGDTPVFERVSEDITLPFQFHLTVPVNRAGEVLRFQAEVTDIDGYKSDRSFTLELSIAEDQPPSVEIIKPANDASAIIDGQDIEVFVEAIDDLGRGGIDRVVFYVNDVPAFTAFDNYTTTDGGFAQENIFRALVSPPEGATGFVLQAEAYDVLGHSARSNVVHVGKVEDTVRPKIGQIQPFDGSIVTENRAMRIVAEISDIGVESERLVSSTLTREYLDDSGDWIPLAQAEIPLTRNDARDPGDATPVSDPDNHYYIYWADFLDGDLQSRTNHRNERLHIVTKVTTPNHEASVESFHEVGLDISERRFLSPADPDTYLTGSPEDLEHLRTIARDVYYTAVDQYVDDERTGAMISAWATLDPMRHESGLGNLTLPDTLEQIPTKPAWTGLFLLDDVSEPQDLNGEFFVYSELLAGSAEIFTGTIGEIHADSNLVLAAKHGVFDIDTGNGFCIEPGCEFDDLVSDDINLDSLTGGIYDANTSGELLLFTVGSQQAALGIPYTLNGRIDMPYPDVYGIDREDDLAFVANGNGGVQVIDISNFAAPYHLAYIKPNGFSRDVKIRDGFAYIAASHEGLVVADIEDPAMPIVATLDTLGVANRIAIEGNRLYMTDMAGQGGYSQLNIIDIADPYHPQLLHVVDLYPARPDLVPDGAYDVHVRGGKAYVSVMYSDQEDRPARSLVEIVDLSLLDASATDITKPVLIHRDVDATDADFAARGMVVARGGVQVAGGKRGINKIALTELSVLGHVPGRDENNVRTGLDTITIELSNALATDTVLGDYITVLAGEPQIGEDVTANFSAGFAMRDGQPATRFIEITRDPGYLFDAGQQYFVIIDSSLAPLTGLGLAGDYVFGFTTSFAGDANAPDIVSVSPSTGGIDGGTRIVVRGLDFGAAPKLIVGGQQLVVEEVLPADAGDPYQKIVATTLPNYAGPAAVEVINDAGLADTVVGAFVYVDQLQISFVDPAVVRISQAGEGDRVDIVGYGFHDDVELLAYPHGQPQNSVSFTVDNDRLSLYSSERMQWTVADFGGGYRGFVDLEVSDTTGARHILENALFYGQLSVNSHIAASGPLTFDTIKVLLEDNSEYTPDTTMLPPGEIVALESDPQLNMLYVLGRGLTDHPAVNAPSEVTSEEYFRNYYAPGWISLVHYQRDQLDQAAPLHGLGYFNLSQDLTPHAIHLGDNNLYVAAIGDEFPMINTDYEGRNVILVYEREDRLPGQPGVDQARDRDVLYALDLPFASPVRYMDSRDRLLFAGNEHDGVAVISLSDPARPTLVKVIDTILYKGRSTRLKLNDLMVAGDLLHLVHTPSDSDELRPPGAHLIYDLTQPSLPQVGGQTKAGIVHTDKHSLSAKSDSRIAVLHSKSPVLIRDLGNPRNPIELGRYEDRGFEIPGRGVSIDAGATLSTTVHTKGGKDTCGAEDINDVYLSIFDTSAPSLVSLLDALTLYRCTDQAVVALEHTDDGLIVHALQNELTIIDSLVQDLVSSEPADNEQNVRLSTPITLTLSAPLIIPEDETAQAYLSRYLALIYDDGSDNGVSVSFTATLSADGRTITIVPDAPLLAGSTYRLEITVDAGTRRTSGLFDYTLNFSTAADDTPPPQIDLIENANVTTDGGPVQVTVTNPSSPVFRVSGLIAPVTGVDTVDADTTRFTITAPSNFAGPATLQVSNANGASASVIGGVVYVELLELETVSPGQGSINGGTLVRLQGRGFTPGSNSLSVFFDDIPVDPANIRVLDPETVEVLTPRGRLGSADVRVSLNNGQAALLVNAFEYQQPVQSSIRHKDKIYDLAVDPTGTYLVTAHGSEGVVIYNIDASTFTGDAQNPLTEEALREFIDRNDDKVDDRIVATVELPEGYRAIGVDTYFERGYDRVFVTAVRLGESPDAKLFVINFADSDIASTSIIHELPLFTALAKGIEVRNNRALIAMGEGGFGIVDAHLHTKAYLSQQLTLPGGVTALDATQIQTAAGEIDAYAVVAGKYDIGSNSQVDSLNPATGGFYVVENDPAKGLNVTGMVNVPSISVETRGDFAFVAAGEGGMVIIDISDHSKPQVISRVTDYGFVHDVDVNGNLAYLALGSAGVVTVDITDPYSPVVTEGMEALGNFNVTSVLAGDYSAITGGSGDAVVQVTPDVVLKIHEVDPENRILDQDALLNEKIIVRFNKAIDLWPENLHRFALFTEAGAELPSGVEIINNDAIVTLKPGHGLATGDRFRLVVQAGVESLKPVSDTLNIRLYRLLNDQAFEFTYRGIRPDELRLESVVPRRVQRDKRSQITVSGLGIVGDPAAVEVYVGGVPAEIIDIETTDTDQRGAIITASLPPMTQAGQYDVTVRVNDSGVWESATLSGGLVVDAPIRLDSISPLWGPLTGGTEISVFGEGFEPGNTVLDAIKLRILSLIHI